VIIKGDTGSALIQDIGKYKIHIGIASFISGNGCESTDPSGYTRTFPYRDWIIVIYEPSAGRRCSRMSAFFKARATKERVPLINARMNGRCLHASGSYNIFCTKIKLNFFVSIH
jgi:hypothetical protein